MTTATDIPADNLVDIDGQAMRRYRDLHRMTQETLARRAAISRSYVAEIERGTKRPRIHIAKALARGLHVKLEEILAPEK